MEFNVIVEIIQGVGFPIFVSVYLLLYQKKETEKTREVLIELKEVIETLTR